MASGAWCIGKGGGGGLAGGLVPNLEINRPDNSMFVWLFVISSYHLPQQSPDNSPHRWIQENRHARHKRREFQRFLEPPDTG